MYTVGLTGGIGSGKSTVADRFAARGIAIIDADVAAHQLTAPGGAAIPAIRAAFGPDFIAADGSLDRARMRSHVFADPQQRRRLEALLHPMIRAVCDAARDAATSPYAILVIPLLFESRGRAADLQRTLLVTCEHRVQVERVMRRSGLTAAEVEAIIATQMPTAQKRELADDVIDNSVDSRSDSGGPDHALDGPIEALHRRYLELASRYVRR